jgi:hypothetical protein
MLLQIKFIRCNQSERVRRSAMLNRPAPQFAVSIGLAFLAGFIAVLIFHQGVLGILHALGEAPPPFAFKSTAPFGVPAVISAAFWGGIWAIALAFAVRRLSGLSYWLTALLFGALALTAVALFVVAPIKGEPVLLQPSHVIVGLAVNGAWGIGTAILFRLFRLVFRSRSTSALWA